MKHENDISAEVGGIVLCLIMLISIIVYAHEDSKYFEVFPIAVYIGTGYFIISNLHKIWHKRDRDFKD